MEDSIDVCSKCGKMPRAIDMANGSFRCSRCGNNQIIPVKGDDYEKVVIELDRRFQEMNAARRIEEAKELPPEIPAGNAKKSKPKPQKKTAPLKKKSVRKR